ncbi:MAG: hypothetical protein GX799_07675, partial [Crenarchaeota archaeon]|nr:hypothetical protein [Thermoproteota archaeon]
MNNNTKICCIVILAMLVVCAILVAPVRAYGDFWVERTPMPNSGVFLKAVTLNDKIHIIGSNYTAASNFHAHYDPVIDTWVSKESMTLYRANFAVATYQDKIYVMGGFIGVSQQFIPTATSANEMYDPATDRWVSRMALPVAEGFLEAVTINEKIYVLGGAAYNGKGYDISGINYVYDPTSDSWEPLASIPVPVYNFAMAAVGDKIYVIGGHLNSQEYSDQTQIYDTQTNTWSFGKPAPITTVSRAAVATTGISAPARIYYIGAED